nr:SDR family oxidoreductase [Streptomyces sp. NBC_00886]
MLDASDEDAVRGFFARLGGYDRLVCTAGEALLMESLAESGLGRARAFLDTRLWGASTAVKYGAPSILEGGSVVLTTGTAGRRPLPGTTAAAALCGAMESPTRALGLELAPLRVNVVALGVVRTELWREMGDEHRDGLFESVAGSLPVGRVGDPEDIAEAHLYLTRGGYATGSTVVVDGGTVLVRPVSLPCPVRSAPPPPSPPSPAGGSRA